MPSTGIDLQPQWFTDANTRPYWYVASMPYYYCFRGQKTVEMDGNDVSTGSIWLGPTFWDGSDYQNGTSGIKYAVTCGSGSTADDALLLKWFHSSSGELKLKILNTSSASPGTGNPFNTTGEWDRPGSYTIGDNRDPLFFGPYSLEHTPFPSTKDGDILIIITGSDILGGNTGSYHEPTDHSVMNLLFYSTGSDQATTLVPQVTQADLQSYSYAHRTLYYQALSSNDFRGAMLFVAASSSNAETPIDTFTWWPMNFDDLGVDAANYKLIAANNAS